MYEKSITREHRTAFVILIDQSRSMAETIEYEGRMMTKASAVADATNLIIGELIERARRTEGVRDYYDIAVIGYSGEGIKSLLPKGESLLTSIVDIAQMEVRNSIRDVERVTPTGERIPYSVTTPVWIEPNATGETPMHEALVRSYDIAKEWCDRAENFDSPPPMIFNITDGESSDSSPDDILNISRKIRALSTTDGNVFLLNNHIASSAGQKSMIFPTLDEMKGCTHRKTLELSYASSVMPSIYDDMICELKGVKGQKDFIALSYNASIAELITVLNIGTISVQRS